MKAIVTPSPLGGSIRGIASKSVAHRQLICAALSDTPCEVVCATTSQDIEATAACLRALGAGVTRTARGFRVRPVRRGPRDPRWSGAPALLDCGESGSTLRFILPVACALGDEVRIAGHGRLAERPLSPLYEELIAAGADISEQGHFPLRARGPIRPGRFILPGDVSSQYVSGLLMAAPLLGGRTEIVVTDPFESRSYVNLTIDALAQFSVDVRVTRTVEKDAEATRLTVESAGYSSPGGVEVEGDWSNAAFWLAAGALGNGVSVTGLNLSSSQGDRVIMGALARLGAHVSRSGDTATVSPDILRGCEINVSDCPDLVPPIAAVAALAYGTTTITGAERLRLKESDRLQTVSAAINAMGGRVQVTNDGLVIDGVESLSGGTVDAANDHRIAMMSTVAASRATSPVAIRGTECVRKSYPAFFEDLARLGGMVRMEG